MVAEIDPMPLPSPHLVLHPPDRAVPAHHGAIAMPQQQLNFTDRSPEATRVLLIEDDASFRDIVSQMLEGAGFAVHAFECAEEALAGLSALDVHVVLTDL